VTCTFCDLIQNLDAPAANAAAVAVPDAFPLSPGHTLVVPRKHVESIYLLNELEQDALWSLVRSVRAMLNDEHRPEGFNIGLNDGKAAGQTIRHAHVHVIPRYHGDVDDPRGGIRWVIPERAPYWND
jgi:diadenosine tetraphosphate (Ap4A) HIT family hydrolase